MNQNINMVKYKSLCPYRNCPLGCRSMSHHRARYAQLRDCVKVDKKVKKPKLSPKINYKALAKLGLFKEYRKLP